MKKIEKMINEIFVTIINRKFINDFGLKIISVIKVDGKHYLITRDIYNNEKVIIDVEEEVIISGVNVFEFFKNKEL